MLGPLPIGASRWMERITDQDQPGRRQPLGDGHRAHAPAHGPASENQAGNRRRQPGRLVADGGDQDGRPVRRLPAGLPVGEVHAHHRQAGPGGRGVDSDEGRGISIRAGAGRKQKPERNPGPTGAHTTARRRLRRAAASSAMTSSSQPASMESDSVRAWVMMRNH